MKRLAAILFIFFYFVVSAIALSFFNNFEENLQNTDSIFSFFNLLKRYEFMFGLVAFPLIGIGILTDGLNYRPLFLRVALSIISLLWLPIFPVGSALGTAIILYAVLKKPSSNEVTH